MPKNNPLGWQHATARKLAYLGLMASRPSPSARRATISDVAELAGVSRTTVSLVLADHPRIPGSTKEKVRSAMQTLGYVYNRAATAVRSGKSSLVGLLVTDIRNPFFADVMMSVEGAAERTGISPIVGFSFGQPTREAQIALSLVEHLIGGLLLLPTPESTAEDLAFLSGPNQVPLVQLLRRVPGLASDYVGVDNLASGKLLGQHLGTQGFTSAVLVGGEHASEQFNRRSQGLSSGLGAPVTPLLGGTAHLAEQLTSRPPDCVVTYNDTHLLSVLHTLRDAGLEPGKTVAVASFDNTFISAEVQPAITSVDHHARDLAKAALDLLLARAANPELEWQELTMAGTLQIRDSTAPH